MSEIIEGEISTGTLNSLLATAAAINDKHHALSGDACLRIAGGALPRTPRFIALDFRSGSRSA